MALKARIDAAQAKGEIWVRRLGPTDGTVLARLARENGRFGHAADRPELEPLSPSDSRTFLADERTICLVAFDGTDPVGFLYAYELYRRHTVLRHLCLYEIGVAEDHRDMGIGHQLLEKLADHARKRHIDRGFVVTNTSNRESMALYESVGGVRGHDDDVVFVLQF